MRRMGLQGAVRGRTARTTAAGALGFEPEATPTRAQMTWAQRLRRVFDIGISRCSRCGGAERVLSVITEPRVIATILAHLEARAARAPPPLQH